MTELTNELLTIIAPILTFAFSILIGKITNIKNKLHQIRLLLDTIDDATKDNTITKDELRRITRQLKIILDLETKRKISLDDYYPKF